MTPPRTVHPTPTTGPGRPPAGFGPRPGGFEPPADARLLALVNGHVRAALLTLAARLDLSELVADGPRSVDELALATGARPDPLRRVLRALASFGVFAETPEGTFAATDLSEAMRPGGQRSVRSVLLWLGSDAIRDSIAGLEHTLRTGEPAYEHVHGVTYWEWLAKRPQEEVLLRRAAMELETVESPMVLGCYDFSPFRSVVDVGGSWGGLLTTLLLRYPEMRGVLFDLPSALEGAAARLAASGIGDRCTTVAGDFFVEVPAGHDAYLLRSVVHDWHDADARLLLATCRDAMDQSARLLILERLAPERVQAHPLAEVTMLIDAMVLANHGGRVRTEPEYRDLLASAGLRLSGVFTAPAQVSVVEARRAR